MHDAHRHRRLSTLIAAAERATGPRRLADVLVGRAWPGGTDGTNPAARDWLTRWGPGRSRAEDVLQACGCGVGACTICN